MTIYTKKCDAIKKAKNFGYFKENLLIKDGIFIGVNYFLGYNLLVITSLTTRSICRAQSLVFGGQHPPPPPLLFFEKSVQPINQKKS